MNTEVPLQYKMFSEGLVDNRTTAQKRGDRQQIIPKQQEMFSLRETVEIGVSVRPWLSQTAKPPLGLICEDPRTEDEIERDQMREAEALTGTLFAEMPELDSEDEPERGDPDSETDHEQVEKPIASEEVTKLSTYRALVNLVREQAVTLWVDGVYRQRFYSQLPLTILSAQGAGLTASEISAAMQIGEFLGNRERQSAGQSSAVIFDANVANGSPLEEAGKTEPEYPSPPLSPHTSTRRTRATAGFRARLRRERIPVRTRQPQPLAPEVVPTLWMEREHIQKRLPYLAESIAHLAEDELASLAESISEVLQETYWTILGITLAHYLDHEQRKQTT